MLPQCGGVNGCLSLHHPWLFWGETTAHKTFVTSDQEVPNLLSLNQGLQRVMLDIADQACSEIK